MFARSYRLPFTLLGIPLYLDISFLLMLPLFAWMIGSSVIPMARQFDIPLTETLRAPGTRYLLGFIAAIGLFTCVVLHELGHAIAARTYGVEVRRITLWFLGGVAQFEEIPRQRGAEAIVGIAGPAVSFALAGIFWLLAGILAEAAPAVRFVVHYLAWVNFVLAIFNLIPALPLDGGRILRSLLAIKLPYLRATQISAGISKTIAMLLGLWGLISLFSPAPNPWLLLIALFIYFAVAAETSTTQIEELLRGVLVRDVMNRNVSVVPAGMTVGELMQRMLTERHLGFPVVNSAGEIVGIVTIHDVQGRDPSLPIKQVMRTKIPIINRNAEAVEAFRKMLADNFGRVIVVDEGGRMMGIVTKTDLMRLIQLRSLSPDLTAARDAQVDYPAQVSQTYPQFRKVG